MNIEEVKIAKDKMESDIRTAIFKAVAKFKFDTSVDVSSIDVQLHKATAILGERYYILGDVSTTLDIF